MFCFYISYSNILSQQDVKLRMNSLIILMSTEINDEKCYLTMSNYEIIVNVLSPYSVRAAFHTTDSIPRNLEIFFFT